MPDNYNLHKELLDLYRSQAGAYYDPSTKAIRTLGGDLPKSQAYFVYLHELVHAHQDQHYDLLGQRRQRALESYDSMTAFNFVIEGHANLLTMASQLGVSKLNEQYFSSQRHLGVFRLLTRFTSIDLSQLKVVEQIAGSSQLTQNLKMMRNTPDILIKQMIDPYFWGQFYWYERASQTSWKTTLEWLSDPPSETRRLIYRDLNSSAGATTLDEGRFDSTFSASMGVYFLLRWLQKLDARPDWGRSLRADRLHLINTGDDSYLAWELLFGETERAGQFVRSLLHNNSDDTTTTLAREHGTAHLTVQKQNNTVLLYIEDDPESEDYDSSQ